MIAVADSSSLIALSICNRLDLLDMFFDKIIVPEAVYRLKVSDLFILILPTAFAVAGSFCFYCYKKKKKVFFLGCLKFLKKIYLFPMTLLR